VHHHTGTRKLPKPAGSSSSSLTLRRDGPAGPAIRGPKRRLKEKVG